MHRDSQLLDTPSRQHETDERAGSKRSVQRGRAGASVKEKMGKRARLLECLVLRLRDESNLEKTERQTINHERPTIPRRNATVYACWQKASLDESRTLRAKAPGTMEEFSPAGRGAAGGCETWSRGYLASCPSSRLENERHIV